MLKFAIIVTNKLYQLKYLIYQKYQFGKIFLKNGYQLSSVYAKKIQNKNRIELSVRYLM